jgi:hypothetical protein
LIHNAAAAGIYGGGDVRVGACADGNRRGEKLAVGSDGP